MSKAQLFFVAAVLFALGVAVFALQNTEEVSIRFLMWEFFAVSKVIVILASAAVSALAVTFLGLWWYIKNVFHLRHLEGEIRDLKSQLLLKSVDEAAPTKVEAKKPPRSSMQA